MVGELFGKLFGTTKAAESLIDNTSKALDKIFYTDEEKAEDAAKAITEARSMVVEWLRNTQGQNLSRRFIALVITMTWLVQYLTVILMNVCAIWIPDKAGQLQASSSAIGEAAESMTGAMMLILGFYFAAPHIPQIASAAIARFAGGDKK